MPRRRATGPPKPKHPEAAPFDALAFKEKVQAELYEATKGMTREEERAFYREAVRTGPLAEWWARAEAETKARAEPSHEQPGPERAARRSSEAKRRKAT